MKYDISIYMHEMGFLTIDVPDQIFLVHDLVTSDIQEGGAGIWLEVINKVLSKESSYEEITGNVCTMEVNYEVTNIIFEYAEEGEEDHCLIETEELKQIFMLWDEAIERKHGENSFYR
ncbi:hypothetical protein [Priestia koreensis]|uniref:hypothetical protein n=1 Tax=Priestia koreensis TaxID=284581 RepID=UPI00301859B1